MDVPVLPWTDIFILCVPSLLILAMWMFGLDTRFANPTRVSAPRRFFCEIEENGIPFLSDPDGSVWQPPAPTQADQLPAPSPRAHHSCEPPRAPGPTPARRPPRFLIRSYTVDME